MFYKVIKDGKIIDILDSLVFVKYQKKHDRMVFSDMEEAQAILSSDRKYIWHTEGLYRIPVEAGYYDVVELQKIDKYEYEQLKMFGMKTIEEVLDAYTLLLINEEVI
jgi:hypothetical protein